MPSSRRSFSGSRPRRRSPICSLAEPSRVRPASTPDVWIWADSFTDHFASATGQAALALFAAAGIEAKVIPERACCALTWVTTGQLDQATKIIDATVHTLYPYVASGVPIIGLEPSCLASIRGDAPELSADPRTQEVAAGMFTTT